MKPVIQVGNSKWAADLSEPTDQAESGDSATVTALRAKVAELERLLAKAIGKETVK